MGIYQTSVVMVWFQKFKKHVAQLNESFKMSTYNIYFGPKIKKLEILGLTIWLLPYMGILPMVNIEKSQKKILESL